MKKITTLLMTCLVAMTAFSAMAIETSDFVIDEGMPMGDVTGDNKVDVEDVNLAINVILGLETDKNVKAKADVTGDNKVDVEDVNAIINMILGLSSGGTTGGSVIKMSDFVPNSGSTTSDMNHQWAEGEVIFIAVDPDYTSACQNVYAMVRTGGKWVLKDVKGSNKQGFKTIGGKLCAAYVQHADLENSYYDYIPLKGDVACVNRAANYTVIPKDGKFYIRINDILLYHFVSRIDVNAAYEGDYFYSSVTHLDALTQIRWQPFYSYSDFEKSHRAPVIDINSNHQGSAYGVWEKGTRVDDWLTLYYNTANKGYSYFWNYTQDELKQGCYLSSIYSPWQNAWNRDLYMNYYNGDERKSYRLNAGSVSAQSVNINVGTNIIFRPWDGVTSDTRGTMTSVTSSTNGILDINYDNTQVSVIAHKVGTTTLTIKFKTKDGLNTVYTYNVKVDPTVWAAGKTSDNKPMLWRNWESKGMYLSGRDNYTSANEVIVRGSTAYVMMRKDVSNTNTDYYSGTAAILKATGAHGGGYFNVYKDGLTGASKIYCKFPKANSTRYIAGIPHLWVTKNNDVYYTTAYRENYSDEYNCIVSTDIYKNRSFLSKASSKFINDLVTDDSGNLYYAGINSNIGSYDELLAIPYIYLGDATGYLAKLTTSNSLSVYPWIHYLFNRLFVKDGTVYVDAYGFYEKGSYETYYWSFGKNVFLRYTSSTGLQLYTGQVSENGLSMLGSNYNSYGTLINPGTFLLEGNKFYYSGGIRTYQLGASESTSYTAYPSGVSPLGFDVKNGYIGMVLKTGNNSAHKVMTSTLNSYNDGKVMENSAGTTIYDVWLQTSLDD
ncbi:MAG: dockerin type I repeat-containing protein [Muribaculaceae bacterium]|nr:dockerin type I repeat-containing protein [Muribaculaceae bacterium]